MAGVSGRGSISNRTIRLCVVAWIAPQAAMAWSACDPGARCDHPACEASICTSPCDRYEAYGFCEKITTRCCEDRDCPVGICDESTGYCHEFEHCFCFDDDNCPMSFICISTYRACGICVMPASPCAADIDCDPGYYCKDGTYCQERCCE